MSARLFSARRIATVAAAASLAIGTLSAVSAHAATGPLSILPTTTTLTASQTGSEVSPIPFGQPVTLTATVGINVLGGLLLTPSGTIDFTFLDNLGVTQQLGEAPLSSCLLIVDQCTASLTTKVAPGTNPVTASYSGDFLTTASSATLEMTSADEPAQQTPQVCDNINNDTCFFQSPDSPENATLSAGQSFDASGQFITPNQSCDANQSHGKFEDFDWQLVGGTPNDESLDYEVVGGVADNALTAFGATLPSPTPPEISPICLGQSSDFHTTTGTAIYDPQTQQFVGIPQFCSEGPVPCVSSTEAGTSESGDTYDVIVQVTAGSPTVGLQQLLDLLSL
jgi:hypothetical protein